MAVTKKEAIEKIRELIVWFKVAELPAEPFWLNKWTKVKDCKMNVATQIARMESMDVHSKEVQNAYHQLTTLKKYLESNKAA